MFLVWNNTTLYIYNSSPLHLVAKKNPFGNNPSYAMSSKQYIWQVQYDYIKMILVVKTNNAVFYIIKIPTLQILKKVKPAGKLIHSIFHQDITLTAELHLTKKTRAIRLYDPVPDKFYTYIRLRKKFVEETHFNGIKLFYTTPFFTYRIILQTPKNYYVFEIPYKAGKFQKIPIKSDILHTLEYLQRQDKLLIINNETIDIYNASSLKILHTIKQQQIPYNLMQTQMFIEIGFNSVIFQTKQGSMLIKNIDSSDIFYGGYIQQRQIQGKIDLPQQNKVILFNLEELNKWLYQIRLSEFQSPIAPMAGISFY